MKGAGERSSQAQNAVSGRLGRADDLFDPAEAFVERNRPAELHAHDAVARQRRDAGRILEHAFDEAIAAGLERYADMLHLT